MLTSRAHFECPHIGMSARIAACPDADRRLPLFLGQPKQAMSDRAIKRDSGRVRQGRGEQAAATTVPTPTGTLRTRVVGATAIASAALVVIDNTVVGSAGSPTYGAPVKEVLAFHADHPAAVAIAVGLEALNVPLLLLFLTGLHGLVGRRGGAGADWSRLAVAAGATLSAVMAFYAVLWDGVVLSAGDLTEPSPVLELAWQMHAAAFAWSLPALGTTFIGAALATHANGLTPPWQRLLGVTGGGLLLAVGAANLAVADGSALVFVGVAGLAAWLVWLLATGVRLMGARTADRPDVASSSDEEE